jgi:thioredoxin 1
MIYSKIGKSIKEKKVMDVGDDNFKKEVTESGIPVLVDFWATWCMPCKMIAPVVEALSAQYTGKLKVCKVNVDESPETTATYNIVSIPTLMLFVNGEVKEEIIGAVPRPQLEATIKPYISA